MNRNHLLIAFLVGALLVVAPPMIFRTNLSPTPITPTPDEQDEDATPEGPCIFCDGQGWIGDGSQGEDCSHCDHNGDGNKKDPLPDGIRPSPTTTEEDFGEIDEEDEPAAAPIPRQFWFEDKQEAFAIAERSGRNVIALISPTRNKNGTSSCKFCGPLADNLEDNSRLPDSPTEGWVGWLVYQDESTEDLSGINSFPYVGLYTTGEIDPVTAQRTPKILWEGVVGKDQINQLHKNLSLFTPAHWNPK